MVKSELEEDLFPLNPPSHPKMGGGNLFIEYFWTMGGTPFVVRAGTTIV